MYSKNLWTCEAEIKKKKKIIGEEDKTKKKKYIFLKSKKKILQFKKIRTIYIYINLWKCEA